MREQSKKTNLHLNDGCVEEVTDRPIRRLKIEAKLQSIKIKMKRKFYLKTSYG
jgi:hypothetical protein